MSFTDPSAEPAQPQEGQGEEASGGGSPWESYLDRIPEDARDIAAEAFREMEANATKKFQEHSEFRKQWEPLQETGINQLSQDEVAWLVQFRQALDDPKTIQQWYEDFAQEHGLTPAEQAAETLDEFGFQDPSQQLEKLLEEKLGPLSQQVEQVLGWRQQQEQAQAQAEAGKFIEGQISELKEKHGDFDKDTEELINTLAGRYIESDPMNAIPRAWDDLQRWRNDVEKSALQAKVNQPSPAESGGVPDVNPPEYKRINDPAVKEAALALLRSENRA